MTRIVGAVLCVLFVAAGTVHAERQWLQYRFSSDQYSQTHYGIAYASSELTAKAPAGAKLPAFSSEDPLFARWKTPMVGRGYLLVAFDRVAKTGVRDRLYIDSDADGSLADEQPVEPCQHDERRAKFGPVRVLLPGTDGPITYHLVVDLIESSNGRRLYFWSGGWYQGQVTIAGVERPCLLVDNNCNGTFDDATCDLWQSDHFVVYYDGSPRKGTAGKYLQVEMNGELLNLKVARDGAWIDLSPADPVKMGTVEFATKSDYLELLGENGFFRLKPVDGKVQVPLGTYRINQCHYPRTDEAGVQWKLMADYFPPESRVKVSRAGVTRIASSEPLQSSLQVAKDGRTWNFSHSLGGAVGERATILRGGEQAPAPRLRITNAEQTYDRLFSFEYG